MRFERPEGHAEAVAGLWRAARAGRLPHALLFSGPEGSGRFLAAEWLAFGLLCASGPGEPCGACGPCKRLRAESHPDAFVLDPLGSNEEEIKVGRIAPRAGGGEPNVLDFLSLRPMEGGWRVVLVREAERMNASAQNALLKTLEEPGERALLVLESSAEERLLATVRSRCIKVALGVPPRAATLAILARHGLSGADAERLARWSGGAPGRALRLAAQGAPALRELLAGVLSGSVDPLAALALLGAHEGDFGGGTPRQLARQRARAFLDLALGVLGDLLRAEAGLDPAGLAHGDLAGVLPDARADDRARRLEAALAARQDVEANLAPEAVLEELLLALGPAAAAAGGRP